MTPNNDELTRAIEDVEGYISTSSIRPRCYKQITIVATAAKELQKVKEERNSLLNDGVYSEIKLLKEQIRVSDVAYQYLFDKAKRYEEVVKAAGMLSFGGWSCCMDGQHSTERTYCIPGKRLKLALHNLNQNPKEEK